MRLQLRTNIFYVRQWSTNFVELPSQHKSAQSSTALIYPLFCQRWVSTKIQKLLLFGPPSLGCFGFTDKYTDQGINQLQLFIGHIQLNQEIGTLELLPTERFSPPPPCMTPSWVGRAMPWNPGMSSTPLVIAHFKKGWMRFSLPVSMVAK